MFSHAHDTVFGDHLVLVTTARWRMHACCKITVSQPWRKYSCVVFFEAAGAEFCDNATAWTALQMRERLNLCAILQVDLRKGGRGHVYFQLANSTELLTERVREKYVVTIGYKGQSVYLFIYVH